MSFAIWTLIIGALLISMALSGILLKRLPLSTAMLLAAAADRRVESVCVIAQTLPVESW
jgi:uncharacterized membrane protein YbaN (DUF454 family)